MRQVGANIVISSDVGLKITMPSMDFKDHISGFKILFDLFTKRDKDYLNWYRLMTSLTYIVDENCIEERDKITDLSIACDTSRFSLLDWSGFSQRQLMEIGLFFIFLFIFLFIFYFHFYFIFIFIFILFLFLFLLLYLFLFLFLFYFFIYFFFIFLFIFIFFFIFYFHFYFIFSFLFFFPKRYSTATNDLMKLKVEKPKLFNFITNSFDYTEYLSPDYDFKLENKWKNFSLLLFVILFLIVARRFSLLSKIQNLISKVIDIFSYFFK